MGPEIEVQLFKKLRYANLSGYTNVQVKITVNEVGTTNSQVFDSPIWPAGPACGEYDQAGETVMVPYPAYYISAVTAWFNVAGNPPAPGSGIAMNVPGESCQQITNLVVLTGPYGSAMTAFEGNANGTVIAGECWLAP